LLGGEKIESSLKNEDEERMLGLGGRLRCSTKTRRKNSKLALSASLILKGEGLGLFLPQIKGISEPVLSAGFREHSTRGESEKRVAHALDAVNEFQGIPERRYMLAEKGLGRTEKIKAT